MHELGIVKKQTVDKVLDVIITVIYWEFHMHVDNYWNLL